MSLDLNFDPTWEPDEVQALNRAADRLERFDTALEIPARVCFLLAPALRSHARAVQQAWVDRRWVDADSSLLALAKHINETPS